jgi:mRNA interferase MazF
VVSPAGGAVVLLQFPFSDLSDTKLRPAIVLANADRGDWVLCQVTSKPYGDARAIPIEPGDFAAGSLRVTSFARPGKLFTASQNLMVARAGVLKTELRNRIVESVVNLLREGKEPG